MAALHNGDRAVDLSTIEDDQTTELNLMLLRNMHPRLRRAMKDHCFRHDLPELDLTRVAVRNIPDLGSFLVFLGLPSTRVEEESSN